MYHMRGTESINGLSQDLISSISTTPFSTIQAALMKMSLSYRVITAVAFGFVIVVTEHLAFLLAVMIQMWAGAFRRMSTLVNVEAISCSILFESGTLSSLLNILRLSAMLDPAFGAGPRPGPGPACVLGLLAQSGTVSPHPAVEGAEFSLGTGCDLGRSFGCSLGSSCCCSGWRFSGASSSVVSACCAASSPHKSALAVISESFSLLARHCATPFMVFENMFVIPGPTACCPHCRSPPSALPLAFISSFPATVPPCRLPRLPTGLQDVHLLHTTA
jgi:hypothetical protein